MSSSDLQEFLIRLQSDIEEKTRVNGYDSLELGFTDLVVEHMSDNGMTFEESEIFSYKRKIRNANVRLNGFSLDQTAENLDLYVSLYSESELPTHIPDAKIKEAFTQCTRYITNCVEGKFDEEIKENHPAYALSYVLKETYASLDQIRIFVITDNIVKKRKFNPMEVAEKIVKVEVIDLQRLYNHWVEGKAIDELSVNFNDEFDMSLSCLWVDAENVNDYEYGLTIFSGEMLEYLYKKHGTRILQANVRSFLQERGKVNKEISQTLQNEPDCFMAYNNGLVIVANEVRFGKHNDVHGINFIRGMQIVNGGQTTASMFFTKRKFPNTDLSEVRVAAKIIKISEEPEVENFIGRVARFANLANPVRDSDLTSNHKFHINLEEIAEKVFCPDGVTQWFYERSTGSYNVMLNKKASTPAQRKKLKDQFPTNKKIIKTNLAKYYCAWAGNPSEVSKGAQKCFKFFMDEYVENEKISIISNDDFKEIIAIAILFKGIEKVVRYDKNNFKAFQANITAYTVSIFSRNYKQHIDLNKVWERQELSPPLIDFVRSLAILVNQRLEDTSSGRMISEWAKKPECWESLKEMEVSKLHSLNAPEKKK